MWVKGASQAMLRSSTSLADFMPLLQIGITLVKN